MNQHGAAPVIRELAKPVRLPWTNQMSRLTFTSGPISGKSMVVQVVNTGADLGDNQFDLAIPGAGQGDTAG
jgi:hypothetical protein